MFWWIFFLNSCSRSLQNLHPCLNAFFQDTPLFEFLQSDTFRGTQFASLILLAPMALDLVLDISYYGTLGSIHQSIISARKEWVSRLCFLLALLLPTLLMLSFVRQSNVMQCAWYAVGANARNFLLLAGVLMSVIELKDPSWTPTRCILIMLFYTVSRVFDVWGDLLPLHLQNLGKKKVFPFILFVIVVKQNNTILIIIEI